MNNKRLAGVAIIIIGVILLVFGLSSSSALPDKLSHGITGRYTENTMWYLIGGVSMIVGGGALSFMGRPKM